MRRRNTILQALERLRAVDASASMTHLIALLYICENEGLNVSELAQVCRTTRATASRTARALTTKGTPDSLSPHMGLVELRPSPVSVNGRSLYLTERGRALRLAFDEAIRAAHPILAGEAA